MKPRIKKASGRGWWCECTSAVGYGPTPHDAYLAWAHYFDMVEREKR